MTDLNLVLNCWISNMPFVIHKSIFADQTRIYSRKKVFIFAAVLRLSSR